MAAFHVDRIDTLGIAGVSETDLELGGVVLGLATPSPSGRGRHNRRLLRSSTGAPQRWGWQSESQPRSSPAAAESPRRECWRGGLQAQPIGLEWRIRVDQGERFADGLSDQQSIERVASQLGVTNSIHSTSGESK